MTFCLECFLMCMGCCKHFPLKTSIDSWLEMGTAHFGRINLAIGLATAVRACRCCPGIALLLQCEPAQGRLLLCCIIDMGVQACQGMHAQPCTHYGLLLQQCNLTHDRHVQKQQTHLHIAMSYLLTDKCRLWLEKASPDWSLRD